MEGPNHSQQIDAREADGKNMREAAKASRMATLAKRIQQRRKNDEAINPGHGFRECTAATLRCPEARNLHLDTPECCKAHIRRISQDLATLLDAKGIRWWIDYGTLLGYVRDGGIIRYDKDGDWGVHGDDRELLLSIQPELLAMGYHAAFNPIRPTQRFRSGDRMKVCVSNRNRTNVDIFVWYPDKPKEGYMDRKNYIGADLYKGREFPTEWVFPLQRGTWEGIDVSIPAEPELMAAHRYGETWQEERREKHPAEPRK